MRPARPRADSARPAALVRARTLANFARQLDLGKELVEGQQADLPAMTDEQIAEIYSVGRESFFGGQRAFQLQAYPFRMTPANLAKHRNNPNMPFWKMIKQGWDHFEVTRHEPKVDFCEKKYVFDAAKPPNADIWFSRRAR